MWHPGDCFDPESAEDRQRYVDKVNKLWTYPESHGLEGDSITITIPNIDAALKGLPLGIEKISSQGLDSCRGALKASSLDKRIVVHVRRGNIVPDFSINPRYIDDDVYKFFFVQLEKIIQRERLEDHEIVILTDGPIDKEKTIKLPKGDMWRHQTGMNVDPNDELVTLIPFNTSMLNPNLDYTIINDSCSIDAFEMMLNADWLVSGTSAFSQAAAMGGAQNVIMPTNVNSAAFVRYTFVPSPPYNVKVGPGPAGESIC